MIFLNTTEIVVSFNIHQQLFIRARQNDYIKPGVAEETLQHFNPHLAQWRNEEQSIVNKHFISFKCTPLMWND